MKWSGHFGEHLTFKKINIDIFEPKLLQQFHFIYIRICRYINKYIYIHLYTIYWYAMKWGPNTNIQPISPHLSHWETWNSRHSIHLHSEGLEGESLQIPAKPKMSFASIVQCPDVADVPTKTRRTTTKNGIPQKGRLFLGKGKIPEKTRRFAGKSRWEVKYYDNLGRWSWI